MESRLAPGSRPLEIADAFRTRLGLRVLYVADLDAIVHGTPGWSVYSQLIDAGLELLIDAGVDSPGVARKLVEAGAARVIVGLESCPGPSVLREIVAEIGPDRLIFSLDLQAGRPLVAPGCWPGMTPIEIARTVLPQGMDGLILLDLAGVGVGEGVPTADLGAAILREFPGTRLITGGGVRNVDDLALEADRGSAGVLVASALHSGKLNMADLSPYTDGWPASS